MSSASSPLDFVYGIGHYLMPSDMALHPGNVEGYNNDIQIAKSDAVIGHNPGINEPEPINPGSKGDKAFQGKTAPPAGTVHRGPQAAEPLPGTNGDGTSAALTAELQSDGQATAHEEGKTALVAAGIAIGLVVLWLVARSRLR
ncbi:MAG: hypothetical protein AB2541_01265 [Candidatus Thiodiazotropha sp.]